MGKVFKSGLFYGASLMSVVAASPALAQDAGASGTGDIIVTARRVEERLQDVPISISVFNQGQLDRRNITSTSDLANITPSLSINPVYGPDKATFSIRGFTQAQSTAATVGVYFADVVGVRAQGGTSSGGNVSPGAFMDLQNVQVLKGPQGTLFGRNTTGGDILLVPKKPTDKLEGYVEGSIGDYNLRRVQAVLNIPLADTFKVRIGVDHNERDGYIQNISGIGPKYYNNVNYTALRLSILADLAPDLENYTIVQYGRSHNNGYAYHLTQCDTSVIAVSLTAGPACAQIARDAAYGPLTADVTNPNPYEINEQWQIINTTTWKASDELTLKNIMSYGEFREFANFDLYSTNFSLGGAPFQYVHLDVAPGQPTAAESTYTEELQLQGNSLGGKLKWVMGGYLELSQPIGWNSGRTSIFLDCTSPENLQCSNPFGFGFVSASRTQLSFNNKGIFAQGTYAFTDQLSFTAGARYTWDSIFGAEESTQIAFLPGSGGPSTMTCNDTVRFQDANGNPIAVSSPSQCHEDGNSVPLFHPTSSAPTWLLNLQYTPMRDVMVYAKYARGYRQGGINFTGVGQEAWDPEKIDAYEIGAKTSFHGTVSGSLDIAAFYNKLHNQQINAALLPKPSSHQSGSGTIVNAGEAVSKGVEVDASLEFFDSLRFDIGYTYNLAKVTTIPGLVDVGGAATGLPAGTLGLPVPAGSPYLVELPSALPGQVEANTPKNRVALTATYTVPVPENVGKVTLGASFTHTDSQLAGNALDFPKIFNVIPATNLVDLNASWSNVMGGPVDLSFFMTNATNQIYAVSATGSWDAAGFGSLQYAPPRMFGFRMRYSFGEK